MASTSPTTATASRRGSTTGGKRRADFLVGADGVQSIVRRKLLGDSPPRYAGYTIWQGITDFPGEAAPIGIFPIIYGPGLRFAYYRVNEQRLYWFAVANAPEGGKDPEGTRKPMLLERFRDWPWTGPRHDRVDRRGASSTGATSTTATR